MENQNSIIHFQEFTSSSNKQNYIKPEEIANQKKFRLSDASSQNPLDLNNYDLSFYIHTNQQKFAEQEVKCQVAMIFKKNQFPLEKFVVKILTSASKKMNEQAKDNFVEEFVIMDKITEYDKDLFVNVKSFQQIKGVEYGYMISLEAAHCSLSDILQQRTKAGKPYTEEELFYIFFDLVRGFVLMEQCGFAHCDIKPNNVFLFLKNGFKNYVVYKIGDFGCAMHLGEFNNIEAFHRKGFTKRYVPKEVYRKEVGVYDIYLCDVYSLGKTMLKLTGFKKAKELESSQKYPNLSKIILNMLSIDRPRFAEIEEKIKVYKKIRPKEEEFLIMYKNDLDEFRKKFIGKEINDMEGIEILRGFQNHMTPYNYFQILEMLHKAVIKSQGMFLVNPEFSTSIIEGDEFIINSLSFYKKEEWQEAIECLTCVLYWLGPLFKKFISDIIQSFFDFCLNFVMIKLYRLQKKNKEFSKILLESEFLTFSLFALQKYIYENKVLRTLIQDPDDIFIRLGMKEYFDAKTYDISNENIGAMNIRNQQECELYLYNISFAVIKAFFYIERKEELWVYWQNPANILIEISNSNSDALIINYLNEGLYFVSKDDQILAMKAFQRVLTFEENTVDGSFSDRFLLLKGFAFLFCGELYANKYEIPLAKRHYQKAYNLISYSIRHSNENKIVEITRINVEECLENIGKIRDLKNLAEKKKWDFLFNIFQKIKGLLEKENPLEMIHSFFENMSQSEKNEIGFLYFLMFPEISFSFLSIVEFYAARNFNKAYRIGVYFVNLKRIFLKNYCFDSYPFPNFFCLEKNARHDDFAFYNDFFARITFNL